MASKGPTFSSVIISNLNSTVNASPVLLCRCSASSPSSIFSVFFVCFPSLSFRLKSLKDVLAAGVGRDVGVVRIRVEVRRVERVLDLRAVPDRSMNRGDEGKRRGKR